MALYYDVAIQVIFFLMLIVCAVTEVRENKIYNVVTYPTILLGLGLNYLWRGVHGLEISALGAAVGFGVYLMFRWMGGMGAGDVKMAAAVGAMKGFPFILDTILWASIFGAILAVFTVGIFGAVTLAKGAAREIRARRAPKDEGAGKAEPSSKLPPVPYGVAIALGGAVSFICWLPGVNMKWVNW